MSKHNITQFLENINSELKLNVCLTTDNLYLI